MPPIELENKIKHLLGERNLEHLQRQQWVALDAHDVLYSLLQRVVKTLTAPES